MWSVKFEVWSAKSAVCSVRCGLSREGHGRDRVSLNYRSFMFGKLPPPACPGLCYVDMHACLCLPSRDETIMSQVDDTQLRSVHLHSFSDASHAPYRFNNRKGVSGGAVSLRGLW